ncbi:hypothetical protein HK102_005119 [Quaeritorhiza haematococci]|nr:hypothetical protein HK102_005119 [Quaeritorhiza haematococci]
MVSDFESQRTASHPKLLVAVGSKNAAKLQAVQKACTRICETVPLHYILDRASSSPHTDPAGARQPHHPNPETPTHHAQLSPHKDGSGTKQNGTALTPTEVEVRGFGVSSGVRDQPLNDEETVKGAVNRAKAALEEWPEAHFGLGTSGRFELSSKIMARLLTGKEELADVIDDLSGQTDVRSNAGAMGILTAGILNRDEAYMHGIFFAFAPFISDRRYWK